MKLTKTAIDPLRYRFTRKSGKKDVRWDDTLPGFGVRVYPGGTKKFIFQYRYGRRKSYLTIGTYGLMTLPQARSIAARKKADLELGIDPRIDRDDPKNRRTVADLADMYMERHAKPKKRSWSTDDQRLNHDVIPAIGTKLVSKVTRADLAKLHFDIGSRAPGTANRVLALLSKMFDLAEEWGLVPAGHLNPARRIERFPENKKDRFVTPKELPELFESLGLEEDTHFKAFVWLLLLTGMRKRELLTLQWIDVNLEERVIIVKRTKAGRPLTLPVSDVMDQIFDSIPRVEGNPHVFPSKRRPGQPVSTYQKDWERTRKRAGLGDVTIHDLRRTFASMLAMRGHSLELIGKALNHSNIRTTQIYAKIEGSPLNKALDEQGETLDEIASAYHDSRP